MALIELKDAMEEGGRGQEPAGNETPSQRRLRLLKQTLMVIGVSLNFASIGFVNVWTNPAFADLEKDNTTIYGTHMSLTDTQMDMAGSLFAAGIIPGTWLGGWVVATIGRRRAMMLLMIPYVLGWSLVALAANPAVLLIGRFIGGMCCGLTGVAGGTYVVELPDVNVRGTLAIIPNVLTGIGFMGCVSVGLILRWFQICYVAISISIFGTLVMFLIPESPTYLVVSGKEDRARKVLKRLRGPDANIQDELTTLRSMNEKHIEKSIFKVILDPAIAKSLAVVLGLFFIQNFCGYAVFIVNATRIFHDAGASLNESVAAILVFTFQVMGTILACLFLDRIGRKVCLILSLAPLVVSLIIMGVYMFFKDQNASPTAMPSLADVEFNNAVYLSPDEAESAVSEDSSVTDNYGWVPLVCLIVAMFAASLGIQPIPWLLSSEYFPTTVRAQATGLCITGGGLFNFASLQLFSPLQKLLTPAGLYWGYASVSFLGIIFCLTCVTETRKKAVG